MSARVLRLLALLAAVALVPSAASAQYPNRVIKIVVPFAPGGGVDVLARLIAEKLGPKLGTNVIVENRAGASGTIGGSYVQQSSPDGYTLLFSSNTHSMAKLVMAQAPYDPLTDFTFIARVGETPLLTVMTPQQPEKTLAEIAASIKKAPDKWTAGTPALGSPSHIATIAFMRLAGVNLTVTPYRGTAPALTDVAGGHIQLLTDAMVVLLPMAKSGQVKGIALTSKRRSALAPDLPTAAESGMPGLDVVAWYGLWGPKGVPADVVSKLNTACADVMKELDQAGRLKDLGAEPVTGETPEDFHKYTAAEVGRNAELLKSVNFQPQ